MKNGRHCGLTRSTLLRKDVFDDLSVDVGEAKVAALVTIDESLMIESQQVQNGGLEIVNMHFVLGHRETQFISFSKADPALDAAAREED